MCFCSLFKTSDLKKSNFHNIFLDSILDAFLDTCLLKLNEKEFERKEYFYNHLDNGHCHENMNLPTYKLDISTF